MLKHAPIDRSGRKGLHRSHAEGVNRHNLTGLDLTIRELAESVAAATSYQGELHWDASKPDGTPKKQLNVDRLAALGWLARIPLTEGMSSTVADFAASGSERL